MAGSSDRSSAGACLEWACPARRSFGPARQRRQYIMLSFGFPPMSSPSARVLILGSLPGRLSLERGEYYANPQNAFWKIVAARIPDLPPDYAGRVAALIKHHAALWDVLAAATRFGSLDA